MSQCTRRMRERSVIWISLQSPEFWRGQWRVASNKVQSESEQKKKDGIIKPKYTKTEDITVTKTDPSLLIFGGGNFQMKWAKKWLSNTLTHSHHIFIKMLWPTKEQFSIQFILFCYCYNKVIKLWWKSVIPSDNFFPSPTFSSHFYHNVIKMDHVPISPDTNLCICCKIVTKKYFHEKKYSEVKIQAHSLHLLTRC